MKLHSKQLGTLGETKVIADLIAKGYEVFKEVGDNSKTDIIALDNDYNPWKIQVKCYSIKDGVVSLSRTKSGPGYSFSYERKHADIYAVYIHEIDFICYISAPELMEKRRSFTIRITPAKNSNTKLVNLAENYSDFERALRDCTRSPSLEGGGTVQTSTTTVQETE
jgi:hypothetical protein